MKLGFIRTKRLLARLFGRENAVPLVDVTWYEGRSPEQKEELARAVCEAFVKIGDARSDSVHVIFRDIDRAEWFKSAALLEEER